MKKKSCIIIGVVVIICIIIGIVSFYIINKKNNSNNNEVISNNVKELPKPEITGGARGELGIDKNINEDTIDEYLGREDSVYRDMRMLEDPGNFEAIGGDRYLSGYVDGFEVIPLPYIIPVSGLPSEVGDTYTGTTLFYEDNGTYYANYKESMDIIEQIFPKDKVIFLMCGGGGYAGMTKNFLVSMGWDENKIYNVGGYWYYKGKHSISTKNEVNGEVSYNFDNVPYHKIEFKDLTKSDKYKEPDISVTELKISTSKIEIEEGTSFKLNTIVVPNNATNKEIEWMSSDESIATVGNDGLVKAVHEGNAVITSKLVNGNKRVSCDVVVKKKDTSNQIILDDISNEANEFALYDSDKIAKKFKDSTENPDGSYKEGYYDVLPDGSKRANERWKSERDRYEQELEEALNTQANIYNKLIANKKSFVIIRYTKECEEREYSVADGAAKILKQNGYGYLYEHMDGRDVAIGRSNLDLKKLENSEGSIVIVKEGKIYAVIDPNVDTLKDDNEVRNWLSKYIKID